MTLSAGHLGSWSRPSRRRGSTEHQGLLLYRRPRTLLQRGGRYSDNLALHYRLRDLLAVVEGRAERTAPQAKTTYWLGNIDDVALGLIDGAALADGRWVYKCVAKDSSDA